MNSATRLALRRVDGYAYRRLNVEELGDDSESFGALPSGHHNATDVVLDLVTRLWLQVFHL
jgi:hypothetical protein